MCSRRFGVVFVQDNLVSVHGASNDAKYVIQHNSLLRIKNKKLGRNGRELCQRGGGKHRFYGDRHQRRRFQAWKAPIDLTTSKST